MDDSIASLLEKAGDGKISRVAAQCQAEQDRTDAAAVRARMARYLPLCGDADFTDDKAVAPFGSSDIGNVSHVCPTLYVSLYAGNDDRSDIHQTAFLSHVHGEDAKKTLPVAVRAMALCALDVLTGDVKP